MYQIKTLKVRKVQKFHLISEISRLVMVDCLLVLLNILADQLKHIVLDLHCLVVVEKFWKYPEKLQGQDSFLST